MRWRQQRCRIWRRSSRRTGRHERSAAEGGGQRSCSDSRSSSRSERSPQPGSSTSAPPAGRREWSAANPDLGDIQHDVPSTRVADDAGPRSDQRIPADTSDPAAPLTGLCDRGATDDRRRRPQQPSDLRSSRHTSHYRPMRSRNEPAVSRRPKAALTITSPSNMAVFAVMATTTIPDLHLLAAGQATRIMPQRS